MKEIIHSHPLEFSKSGFLVDLVKHSNGKLYVEMTQTFFHQDDKRQTLKLNSSALAEVIDVLKKYQKVVPEKKEVPIASKSLTVSKEEKIKQAYLKGVGVDALALQHGVSYAEIEAVLLQNGMPLVDQNLSNRKKRYRRKCR